MKNVKFDRKINLSLIILFAISAIIIFILSLIYYNYEQKETTNEAYVRLKTIADHKIYRIEDWRKEALANVKMLAESPFLKQKETSYLKKQNNLKLKDEILKRFDLVIKNGTDYVNIMIVSSNGSVVLAYDPSLCNIDSSTKNLINMAVSKRRTIFGNLYKCKKKGIVLVDIAAPIFNDGKNIRSVIIYRLTVEKTLNPIIETWPEISKSAESILLMKEGNNVVYLSHLKGHPNSALNIKIPLSRTSDPSVQAVLGKTGIIEGTDFTGNKVIAYSKPIKNSPWFLISKIDRDELLSAVLYKAHVILIVAFLVFLVVFGFTLYIFYYRRKKFFQELYNDEIELKALKAHFEYVVKYANDIILLEDENLNIVEANEKAVEQYQYSIDELRKLKLTDLTMPASKEFVEAKLLEAEEKGGAISEGLHKRKDGTTFYAEGSARIIKIDGKKFYHQIIRDVTERKKAEEALRESEERFRTTLYSTGDAIITTDVSGCITHLNRSAEVLTGWTEDEAKGKPIKEVFVIFNEDTMQEVESPVEKVLSTEMVVMLSNHTILKSKDGKEIPIGDSGAPIKNEKGEIKGVVLVFRDQSKERAAQKAIAESEARLIRAELTSKTGNWEFHLDDKIMIASKGAAKIYGVDWNEMEYAVVKNVPLPEYRSMMDKALKNLIEENEPYDIEFKIKKVDTGEIKDIHSVAEYDKENRILFGIIQDITERKKLEQSRFQLLNIVEKSLNEIYVFDSQTLKFEYVNNCALQNLGYSFKEMSSLTPVDIKPEYTDETFRQAVETLIKGENEKLVFETFHRRKNGTDYPVEVHLQLNKLENKSVFFAIINDITERKQAEAALRESEERNRTTLYSIGDGVIATDNFGKIKQMNPIAENLTGWKEFEAADKPLEDIFKILNEETRTIVENPVKKVLKEGKIIGLANHTLLISKDGKEVPIADSGAPIKNEKGEIKGVVLVFRDQSKERAAQKAIAESEAQLKQSQRVARIGYYIFDIKANVWTCSEMLDDLFGIDKNYKHDFEGWLNLIHPEHREEMKLYLTNHILKEKKEFNKEYRVLRKNDNAVLWVHGLGSLEFDKDGNLVKMFGTIQDITDRKTTQSIIENSLKEKEIMLKEIHHRVKNNFQSIISLIALQTEHIQDEEILNLFHDLQNRLRSMSLIHELMYGSKDFVGVNIKDYIERLTGYLIKTYSSLKRIKLNLDLEEHSLDLDSIIPCGLIINEAITNSLKYAFPYEDTGNIYISFKKIKDEFCLTLSDDGVGIKNEIDFENISSLGLRLINLFTRQLRGTLEVVRPEKGLQFIIKFKMEC